jgi:hypothetical protein
VDVLDRAGRRGKMSVKRFQPGINGDPVYLHAAFLADRVIVGEDKTFTFVRIIDSFTLQKPQDESTSEAASRAEAFLVFSMMSVNYQGSKVVGITIYDPDGAVVITTIHEVNFGDSTPFGKATLVVQLMMGLRIVGLYAVDITVDGEFVTRVPWQLTMQPLPGLIGVPQ